MSLTLINIIKSSVIMGYMIIYNNVLIYNDISVIYLSLFDTFNNIFN